MINETGQKQWYHYFAQYVSVVSELLGFIVEFLIVIVILQVILSKGFFFFDYFQDLIFMFLGIQL
jgi:hypothetical protein